MVSMGKRGISVANVSVGQVPGRAPGLRRSLGPPRRGEKTARQRLQPATPLPISVVCPVNRRRLERQISHLLTNEANKFQPATLESGTSALARACWIAVPDFRFVDFTVVRGFVREWLAGGAGQWRMGSRLLRAWGMGSGGFCDRHGLGRRHGRPGPEGTPAGGLPHNSRVE